MQMHHANRLIRREEYPIEALEWGCLGGEGACKEESLLEQ